MIWGFIVKNDMGVHCKKSRFTWVLIALLLIGIGNATIAGISYAADDTIQMGSFVPSQAKIPTLKRLLTPTPTPRGSGNPVQCSISAGSNVSLISSTIAKQFGIHVTGNDQTQSRMTTLYSTLCLLFKSTKYAQLIKSQTSPIAISLQPGNCFGHASASTGINLYGSCGSVIDRFIITHELGHMLMFRNPSVYNDWYSHVWPATLPTWDCQLDYGPGPWPAECFADMIGEYLVYPQWREAVGGRPSGSATLSNFPTTYASYYNFARDKIFGGVKYF